ncbi:leucine-rich repeat receptor protein kinase EMS1 [Ricinus communis]|uniref:ATP binding protein, putative n=1 Tax=Ricinus communis TaxID=3988 RepID=B9RB88_RICCO|nr:leucine-rich repeat receptor protein kinase EMS1 [Ricinus communis]EEF50809.1 ATP binding protein, putative [Ricinus communis]|eukprot:XP_002509422.1 leucine-rich repeat receptor protein kinase EMS1 [Ricinus communis]
MNSAEQIAYDFILSLLAITLVILGLVLIFFCRKKPVESEETLSVKVSAPTYSLTDIDAATDGFNHRRIVGTGHLGTVYAAVILPRQQLVAVKRIHPSLVLSNPGFGFSSILKTLSLAQHSNIVPILGFSQAPGERIIVTEFVGMASLDFYLHENSDGGSLLDWSRRLRIGAGAASGMQYLHEGMAPNVVHGCFKASNVLLDVKFCPRVCDYGLYFLAPNEKRGLAGYVDDEYWSQTGGGGPCKASDVYGFGVVLLELLTGRRSEGGLLVKWALPLIKEMKFSELLDPRLALPSDMNQIIRLSKVASACVSNSRKNRPTIVQVAAILNSLESEICT